MTTLRDKIADIVEATYRDSFGHTADAILAAMISTAPEPPK